MIRRKSSLALAAMAAFALAGASTAFSATTNTGTDPFFDEQLVGYFTTGTGNSSAPKVNITVPSENPGLSAAPNTICAMIYVFDANQLLQECCGCPVTSDGLRTLTVSTNLGSEPAFQAPPLTTGVVRIVSAEPNGCDSFSGSPVSAECARGGPLVSVCDATGGTYPAGQYHALPGAPSTYSPSNNADVGLGDATLHLVENGSGDPMKAWGTHINVAALTESEYSDNPITQNDANSLAEACGDIQSSNSATGPSVCSCGTGD